MAQEDKIKINILIIQYITHTETLRLEDQEVEDKISAAFQFNASRILSIMLNGSIIYTKNTTL